MPRNHQQIDYGDKRESLLDAAEESFVVRGWDAATVTSIAAAAGVTATTLYRCFPTKDDHLAAVVQRWAAATLGSSRRPRPGSVTGRR